MNAEAAEALEATRRIAASVDDIWPVISSPAGHVEIDSSGMLMSAADSPALEAVGDTFTIHMDREALGDMPLGNYTVTLTVTKFEPKRTFEWAVGGEGMPPLGHVYGYTLEADGDTTLVTSYCDWSAVPDNAKTSGFFPVISATTLRSTLGILERVVLQRRR
jgi:hypothetical protein